MKSVLLGIGLGLGWLVGGADATSVGVGSHECSLCGLESKKLVVFSYSQFGEPARDLSDHPMFGFFGDVETCPWDLYASWSRSWEIEDEGEKKRLKEFLAGGNLAVELTEEERTLVKGVENELRESELLKILWVRTCNQRRAADPRREWITAMQLFYHSNWLASDREGPWATLHAHWRAELIRLLGESVNESWVREEEKLVFSYLRAELLRQARNIDEARKGFGEVVELGKKRGLDPESDEGWVLRWAQEQGWRMEVDAAGMDELRSWVAPDLPNPWREEEEAEKLGAERWSRHTMALGAIVNRALGGDAAAGQWLWKLLRRDAGRLLALDETVIGPALTELRTLGEDWEDWFDELAGELKAGRVPGRIKAEVNQERNVNILTRLVGTDQEGENWMEALARRSDWGEEGWLRAVLLPAVRNADGEHRLVVLEGTSRKDLLAGLTTLIEKGEPADAKLVTRMAVRMLKEQDESPDLVNWPIEWLFRAICERRRELAPEIRGLLDGEWESGFWKAMCEYAAGDPGARDRVVAHPLLGTRTEQDGAVFENMLWACFTITKDPVWVEKCVKELAVKEWRNSEVIGYGQGVPDPRLEEALMKRHAWLVAKHRDGDTEGAGRVLDSEARRIEERIVERKMRKLKFR